MSNTADPVEMNRELFEQVNEIIFADHDFDRLPEFLAEDVVQYQVGSELLEGIDAIRESFEGMDAAFSKTEMEFSEVVAEGDRVIGRFNVTATNDGPLPMTDDVTLQPTGKTLTWDGFVSMRMADGKAAEVNVLTDTAGFREQLGVQPAA